MDVIDTLQNGCLHVVGNGYHGNNNKYVKTFEVLGVTADGNFSFKSFLQMDNEPSDVIKGNVKGRNIVFTRSRPNQFVQVYNGWAFEKLYRKNVLLEMAGTFSHNSNSAYGWYGWVEIFQPK